MLLLLMHMGMLGLFSCFQNYNLTLSLCHCGLLRKVQMNSFLNSLSIC